MNAKETEHILLEVHEGSFDSHANGHAMARMTLRAGYYWLTMENDCCVHVRKCHKCQTFADNVNALPVPLNVLATPWSFSMWGTDVIGAIEPRALNGHRFILVAIDYFTKWVEAALYQEDRSVDDRIIQGLARHATLRIAWLSDFCMHIYWGNPFLFGVWDGSYAPI